MHPKRLAPYLFGQSKVSKPHYWHSLGGLLFIIAVEQVFGFEVSVENPLPVKKLQPLQDLGEDALDQFLTHVCRAVLQDHIIDRAVHIFEDHIYLIIGPDYLLKTPDIGVPIFLQQFYLS